MRTRPEPGSTGPVLFVSFSASMTLLLGLLFLAACSTDDAPIEEPPVDLVVVRPPLLPATVAPPEQGDPAGVPSEDPFAGQEEVVVTGSAASSRPLPGEGQAVAFDVAELQALGAADLDAIAQYTPNLEVARRRTVSGEGGARKRPRAERRERDSTSLGALKAQGLAQPPVDWNTERYDESEEQGFLRPGDAPLSTFSVDVDTASYANVRRFLLERTRPPAGAVRIEELVNYFRYPRRVASGEAPFAVDMEIFEAPWREEHRVVRIAIEGKELPRKAVPPRNLVFLLDVSGSMRGADRLGLVKYGMERLVETLRPTDRVSIVVYAGASGLVLPPTPGNEEAKIIDALARLEAGGSTAGAAGLELAYRTAREHFDDEGINRVILATDGDFNVGVSNRSELLRMIERERESGVELTVLGVGRGNLNDATMEQLADHGNGNYAYMDSRREARKVLVEQADATLVTIAKDVKIQVEFNPQKVRAYRLIGYENRRLADQDFNDDTKDAGEIGAGHFVTALYEIVPVEARGGVRGAEVDPLRYQAPPDLTEAAATGEWLTLKLRYKDPGEDESQLLTAALAGQPGRVKSASENARFSTAVALFGMLLRESEFKGAGSYRLVERLAEGAIGDDEHGERREFLELVSLARKL